METMELRTSDVGRGHVAYSAMKTWLRDAYDELCRHHESRLKWWHEIVLSGARHEHGNHTPIERVMLCVVQLVLADGRYPEADSVARRWIIEQFERHGFAKLIGALPADEARAFHRDLESLRLV